jgi:restriction endonuclease S subunit
LNSPFDEATYKALLEGLEVSEIRLQTFLNENPEFRLDAEYFSKNNIHTNAILERIGYKRIEEFATVTDGIHTSIDYSDTSGIKLISATSPRENFFDFSRDAFIAKSAHIENPRTALMVGDVIISTVGTIGNCAVVTPSVLPANSDRHVGIIRIQNSFLPNYLSTFLLSKYGRFQTFRESTGNVQLNLFVYKIKSLKIANINMDFQIKIADTVSFANKKREQAQQIYHKAESLLLQEIGLRDFAPSSEKCNIKSFKESFGATGRLDAEYYQKKYEEIIAKIKAQHYDLLGDLVTIKKSIEPGSDTYSDTGIPFVRVADYNQFGISSPDIFLSEEFCKENAALLKTLYPQKGTILFSKDGSVGTAYMLREDMRAITSGALLHLTVKDTKKVLPGYLTLVLNTTLVKHLAERDAGGSIILHWRIDEIKQVVIPIIAYDIQQQIAALITESFRLREESERLLEQTKAAVEQEIERESECL